MSIPSSGTVGCVVTRRGAKQAAAPRPRAASSVDTIAAMAAHGVPGHFVPRYLLPTCQVPKGPPKGKKKLLKNDVGTVSSCTKTVPRKRGNDSVCANK